MLAPMVVLADATGRQALAHDTPSRASRMVSVDDPMEWADRARDQSDVCQVFRRSNLAYDDLYVGFDGDAQGRRRTSIGRS